MRIASWNVNSLNARITHVLRWLAEARPDFLLLQELKGEAAALPFAALTDAGYHVEAVCQKSYNGVAIVSAKPVTVLRRRLPGDDQDEQARYLEIESDGMVLCCLYLPNGNPVGGNPVGGNPMGHEKFDYKLGWMRRLLARAQSLLAQETPFLMAGDFNICPGDEDLFDPDAMREDALCHPQSRALYRQLHWLGLTDAVNIYQPGPDVYSYWDYQAGCWPKNHGLRIDHLLLSPKLADRLVAAGIDKEPRGWEKPSDHTPVWCELR